MGIYFRKSVGFGPFRVNLGKSGVGYSVSGREFRDGNIHFTVVLGRVLGNFTPEAGLGT